MFSCSKLIIVSNETVSIFKDANETNKINVIYQKMPTVINKQTYKV